MRGNFFVEDGEARDVYRRQRGRLFLDARIEGHQSADGAEIEVAVVGFYGRLVVELVAAEAVICGEYAYVLGAGLEAHQSTVGTEPQVAFLVFQHFVGHVVRHAFLYGEAGEIVGLGIVAAESAPVGREPDVAFAVLHERADGVGTYGMPGGCAVGGVVLDSLFHRVVFISSFSHGGEPERAVFFLQDVEHPYALQFRYGSEVQGAFRRTEKSLVRTGPKCAFVVHVERIDAASAFADVQFFV